MEEESVQSMNVVYIVGTKNPKFYEREKLDIFSLGLFE